MSKAEVPAFFGLSFGLFVGVVCALSYGWAQDLPETPEKDPLSMLGFQASTGAAAGYVPDRACGTCHADKYLSYQKVGMARSFADTESFTPMEEFGREFYHEPSQRYYQIRREGKKLMFRRFLRDDKGLPIHEFEILIDWVMGSGNRARSYLYQTESGEMYMLPLGWYSENKEWGMSPGFESPHHPGVLRRVPRECMFCHNAFPEVAEGSDLHWKPQRFPQTLPHGTGCQRCHGPGAEHMRAAITGKTPETIRAGIVNPRRLPPEQRDSVCFQCHMLPTVVMAGSRRFDRPDYSFRPGQKLADYMVHVNITAENFSQKDRFEINHHGYRFWQSRCYRESKGQLACFTCHDPHVKPESKAFRARVSDLCRGCHPDLAASHQPSPADQGECVGCHMPTRRTGDVVLVTMTDHRISRGPFDAGQLVEPIEKVDPIVTDIQLMPFGEPLTDKLRSIYRILPVLRANAAVSDAAHSLKALLVNSDYLGPVPYLDLIESQIKLHEFEEAEKTARFLLQHDQDLSSAWMQLGVAQVALDKSEQGIAALKRSLALDPTPEVHYDLGLAYFKQDQKGPALEQLEIATNLRPNFYLAWMYKGRVLAALGQSAAAKQALIRALEIDPGHTQAYVDLIELLRRLQEPASADRYLAVALRVAREPALLKTLRKGKAE